jgi:hypothetical protein
MRMRNAEWRRKAFLSMAGVNWKCRGARRAPLNKADRKEKMKSEERNPNFETNSKSQTQIKMPERIFIRILNLFRISIFEFRVL